MSQPLNEEESDDSVDNLDVCTQLIRKVVMIMLCPSIAMYFSYVDSLKLRQGMEEDITQ